MKGEALYQTKHPKWVQKQKTTGTTVKKAGNNYYLYRHSSKRVPGKKYPVPVDTYIGRVTPEGIERSGSRKIDMENAEVTVKEYGLNRERYEYGKCQSYSDPGEIKWIREERPGKEFFKKILHKTALPDF